MPTASRPAPVSDLASSSTPTRGVSAPALQTLRRQLLPRPQRKEAVPHPLRERCHCVYRVPVVREQRARESRVLHERAIGEGEEELSPDDASAVTAVAAPRVVQWDLHKAWVTCLGHRLPAGGRSAPGALTCTVRAAASVCQPIQRPVAVVRRIAMASGASSSSSRERGGGGRDDVGAEEEPHVSACVPTPPPPQGGGEFSSSTIDP